VDPSFLISVDEKAHRWLAEHPSPDPLLIAFQDSRCCGGGHIRDLRVRRGRNQAERAGRFIDIGEVEGRRILLDGRIMPRMPRTIPITVGGMHPFVGLHLDFSGEQWARLLYD
jgi:hypothetical protein